MSATAPAPAWYEDPYDTARVRWWNGEAWTTAVREHPVAATTAPPPVVEPPPPPPPPAAPPAPAAPPPPPPPAVAPPSPPSPGSPSAPSFGAALLPPLTPAPAHDSGGDRAPTAPLLAPDATKRSNKLTLVLVAGLVVALLALAFGAYSTGLIGASSRDASTPGATVIEGPDFSIEAPAGWTEIDRADGLPEDVAVVLRGPDGAELGIVRSEDRVEVPDDPEIRRRMIDLMIATQTSVMTDAEVLSRVPATLGGADAELLTVQGLASTGRTEQAYEVVTLHDGRLYLLVLGGPADVVAESKTAFDAIVASFRFE